MTARVRKHAAPVAVPPLQLFVIVDAITGALHPTRRCLAITCEGYEREAVPVFTSEGDAWQALRGAGSPQADEVTRAAWRVVPLIAVLPAPPRETAWGPGQFDRCHLGPGVEAWVRITPEGRVRLIIPGGDLDVTAGAVSLGTGLHEASARAAQIRVARDQRGARRATKPRSSR